MDLGVPYFQTCPNEWLNKFLLWPFRRARYFHLLRLSTTRQDRQAKPWRKQAGRNKSLLCSTWGRFGSKMVFLDMEHLRLCLAQAPSECRNAWDRTGTSDCGESSVLELLLATVGHAGAKSLVPRQSWNNRDKQASTLRKQSGKSEETLSHTCCYM